MTVSPSTTTYYRLRTTCSNGNGQGYSTVVSRTPATVTPGSGNQVCGSGSITLTGTATGGSVQWYSAATGGNAIATGNSYTTPSLTQTATYYAASSGCPTSRSAIMAAVLPNPTASAGSAAAFCDGGSTTLNGSGSTGTGGTGVSVYPDLSTFESGSDGWTQSTQDNLNFTRDSGGTPSSGTGPSSGAQGSTWYYFTETSLSTAGAPYTAIMEKTFNMKDLTAANVNFNYFMYAANGYGPGTLELRADGVSLWSQTTGLNGWRVATVDLTAFVGQPSVTLQFVSTTPSTGTIFQSDNSIDHITVSGTAGTLGYTWAPATGLSSTSTTNPSANPSSNTTYTLTVTSPQGCTATSSVDITVNALPTINATPAARCDDGSVDLGAAPSSGTTVNWYSSATSTNSIGTGALFSTPSLSATTTYYAAATSPEGCVTSPRESITATINALPNANGGPDKTGITQCGLESITMGGIGTSGTTGQWTHVSGPNVLFADPTQANTTVTPQTYGGTTLARWTTTSGAGCDGTDDVEIQFTQPSTGPASSISPQTGDLVWGGMTNGAWSTSTNWYQYQSGGYWKKMTSGEPSSTDMVYIIPNSTGGMCVSSNNNATPASNENVDDLRIMSGATLNLNNGTLNVYGDIVNDGSMSPGSATVVMKGSTDQSISGSGTSTFDKLTVDKTGGDLVLSQPVTVQSTLKMTSGDIDNSQELTLGTIGNTGTLTYVPGVSGHILGKFKRHFDSDETGEMLFPVAKGGIMREGKVTFNQGPGPDQHLSMEVILGAPSQSQMTNNYNGLPFYASDNQLIQVYSNQAFLEIIPTSNNYSSAIMNAAYTFEMHADNMSGVVNNQTVRLIKCAGNTNPNQHHTTWSPCGNHAQVLGSNSDFWVKSTGVTGFSFFGFGSNNDNPLPVELVSFNGNCGDGVVELNWTTASEHNSAYYQIEKSRDGENWDVINTQDAAGNSNEMRSYSFVDAHASAGNNLYRLSQFDIDGDSKTYSVVNVNCAAANAGYFSTHPNPSTGQFHVVLNNQELIGTATIRMVDSRGTIVSQKEIEVLEGINVYNFNEFKVAPGMYYITVVNDDKSTETIKQSIK